VSGPFRPREIFATLERHGVDYVTVGGFAVIAHGAIGATADVDLVPDRDPANLRRLADALVALEADPDGEPETPIDANLLARDANMRFQTSCGQIDVLSRADLAARYGALRKRAIRAEAAGVTVTVVSRDDLLALKAATGRDRDLLDIGDLLAVGEKRPGDA